MILDKETNLVYFSEKIQQKKFKNNFKSIKTILDRHQINYKFLQNTKDIWCRDYMPIQKNKNNFIQFRYEPTYLQDDLEIQSNPKIILDTHEIKATFSSINIDGGNIIKWEDKVILTKRIFDENPRYKEKNRLIADLEKLFEAQIFLIPDLKSDMTGHADGHIRFIDKSTLLVNQLDNENKYWRNGFEKMIQESGLDYIEIPWFETKNKESAAGIYVNYLEMGNLIIFPIFEINNKDDKALEIITSVFKDRIIETVNINDIASEGGLLNCITWTIKS